MEFLEILSAGGDLGVIAIALALWKFDRRLLELEIKFGIKEAGGDCRP